MVKISWEYTVEKVRHMKQQISPDDKITKDQDHDIEMQELSKTSGMSLN